MLVVAAAGCGVETVNDGAGGRDGLPALLPAERERSLVWTDSRLLDDPATVGLGRLMSAIASDGHGGEMLDAWFRSFARTTHSERAAPAQLMDELRTEQGAPATWDLDALPFRVTGIHNRIDLADDTGCGELRVSVASTHPIYAPLHLIFLFRQTPVSDDYNDSGDLDCYATARSWGQLTEFTDAAFLEAARGLVDANLRQETFAMLETVELTVSPWEWRQWQRFDRTDELVNPPLFQTPDVEALNASSALRDDFLAFVEDNAAALSDRMLELPPRFRAPSARAPPTDQRPTLDLTDLSPAVRDAYPDLGRSLEIVGCPACHTFDAEFVQTNVDRTLSDFYDRELDARAARLDLMTSGASVRRAPFGPLQPLP